MRGPREILNELKWRSSDLASAEIWYVHRGAPGDRRIVRGSDVLALHASFMEVAAPRERGTDGHAMIPYHRVFRIDLAGLTIWERASTTKATNGERKGEDSAS